jgi:single-strand DNA-binding protein
MSTQQATLPSCGVNQVVLSGHLSSDPQRREMSSGSVLYTLEVTTDTPEGAVSVPVAWFDPPGEVRFVAGDAVVVAGIVRRRFFRTAGGTQSRTEVLASTVVATSAHRRVQRLLEGVRTVLDAVT